MRYMYSFLLGATLATSAGTIAHARDTIRAVGSSTVYPFITVAAENFGRYSKQKTPIVESTGTGGGFKYFCEGVGEKFPDISNASRAIKSSEVALCKSNGITDIMEIKLGYDGIVLANIKKSKPLSITREQIFQALAKKLPKNGKLVDNPNKKWNDIDKSLPDIAIEVYGPPPTSGTRDAFVELVLEPSCVDIAEFKAAYPDKKQRKKACHEVREDNAFVEAGENDNLIVTKLTQNPDAYGIFGFSFLDQQSAVIQGATIDGVEPEFDTIADGTYPVSRPLFVYIKEAHMKTIPGLKAFVEEIVSENAMGEEGYFSFRGLIPLPEEEYTETVKKVQSSL